MRSTTTRSRRMTVVAAVAAAALAGTVGIATHGSWEQLVDHEKALPFGPHEKQEPVAGGENGEDGGEAFEAATIAEQYDQHVLAGGGIVPPGAYGTAYGSMQGLTATNGTWTELTRGTKYDGDDPKYRDYYSNSSGGAGYETGRITGIAAGDDGYVYAGGADGGVWRSTTGGGSWTNINGGLTTRSTGDLRLNNGVLWYATGEGNTGGTSYVGSGVWVATSPKASSVSWQRVGGDELESTVIQHLRFGAGYAWVATNRGLFRHSVTDLSGAWERVFAPNPSYLPGGADADAALAGYKNIVNDVAVDPANPKDVVVAAGWRSGDTYNGFYESKAGGANGTFQKVNLQGGIDSIDSSDVGQTSFGFSKDGSKLYAVVQSVKLIQKATGTVNSYLKGVYVSNSGSVAGPWTKIADSQKLANSGSALKQSIGGKGYGPGIQSWYNQFVQVDPANPKHLFVGLEEVYESKDGGANWTTPGPYWNFYFGCWDYTKQTRFAGCQQTTHSDQHSVAVGTVNGVSTLFVGNDGGIYSRPVDGKADSDGHATDWKDLNDGSIDTLQYYAVGVGKDPKGGLAVSGGLQDNGGSLLRTGTGEFSSNFGGDGGDVLVDPDNGCNIVQEYVGLSMRVTNTCAESPADPAAFVDPSKANTWNIAPGDPGARFIAPFGADKTNVKDWIAAGRYVWLQDQGFAIRSKSGWSAYASKLGASTPYVYDLGAGHSATAVAMNNGHAAVAWCGPCGESGFKAGIAVGEFGKKDSWKQLDTSALPARYIGGVDVAADGTVYAVTGGFSRKFTDGPGSGLGHVWAMAPGAATFTGLDGTSFPDVPSSSVKADPQGNLYVGSDLGVLYRAAGSTTWQRLGDGFPPVTVMDVELYGGDVYVATHGRGLWKYHPSATSSTTTTSSATTTTKGSSKH